MKQRRRPTRRQMVEIQESGLTPSNWLIERDTPSEMVLVHRYTNDVRVIQKGA